MFAKHIAALI